MAVITISSNASLDARSANTAAYVSGLTAGEDLGNLNVCRLSTDGKVYRAVSTSKTVISSGSVANVCDYVGFVGKAVSSGQPVTVFRNGAMAGYSSGMTPNTFLYVAATAGGLSGSPVVTGDEPVAMAISDSDIIVIK
jgi:hypothetical protein